MITLKEIYGVCNELIGKVPLDEVEIQAGQGKICFVVDEKHSVDSVFEVVKKAVKRVGLSELVRVDQ